MRERWNKLNLKGHRYGRLLVISELPERRKIQVVWDCLCDCGKSTQVTTNCLRMGVTKSCGCLIKEIQTQRCATHGLSKSKGYSSWIGMKQRCYNVNNTHYKYYGGRGVTVCDRWLGEDGFINFINDIGEKPFRSASVDRYPNKNGNYEPTNVRWASKKQQVDNRSNNVCIEYNGQIMTRTDWARKLGITQSALKLFLNKSTMKEAFEKYKKIK